MPYTQQAWHLPQITLNSKMYLRLALLQGRWMVLKYKGRGQDLRASSNKWSYIYQNMFSKIWRGAIAPLLPISDGPVLYCCQWVPLGSLFNNGLHLTFYGIYNIVGDYYNSDQFRICNSRMTKPQEWQALCVNGHRRLMVYGLLSLQIVLKMIAFPFSCL